LDEDDGLLLEDLDDAEALDGDALVAELAGHLEAGQGAARGHVAADRAAVALVLVAAVGHRRGAREVVAAHDAREAAALAGAGHVDEAAGREELGGGDGLADIVGVEDLRLDAELTDDLRDLHAGLRRRARLRLLDVLFL